MSPNSTPSTAVAPAAIALAEKIRLRQATVAVVGLHQSERFVPTSDPATLTEADAILLCLPILERNTGSNA